MRARLIRGLERTWYRPQPAPLWLRGCSFVYGTVASAVAASRRSAAVRLPVPVVVVGNIAVGGTGKTPFVIWLVERLRAEGWRPGVLSRGYAGRAPAYPLRVDAGTDPAQCGDEPALLARRLGVPLAVAPDRVAAARLLLARGEVDVLVADDGLQHHRLARDLEICVVDGARGLGNGALLPAGPLREPPARLDTVNLLVVNGGGWRGGSAPAVDLQLEIAEAVPLGGGERRPLAGFGRAHAVAGIGNPGRFFAALRAAGLELVEHAFPDHHRYARADLDFGDGLPVLMTEKDAVKCGELDLPGLWSVPAEARLSAADAALVGQLLRTLSPAKHKHG